MRAHVGLTLVAIAAVAAGCAKATTGIDPDAEIKIDGAPRADAPEFPDIDAPPHIDAPPVPDAPPGTPDAPPPPPDGPPAAAPDTCANAHDLTAAAMTPAGAEVNGSTAGYANDTQPTAACTGYIPDGPDAIYKVTVGAGQTITALVTPGDWDTSIFISSNCTLAAACLAGADDSPFPGPDLGWELVQHAVTAAGTYYVVVDGWEVAAFGTYTLDVAVD